MQPIRLTHHFLAFILCLPLLAQTLPQEAYVWQRVWSEPVRESITAHAEQLDGLTCLAAEITPRSTGDHLVMIPMDFGLLRDLKIPITLAVRAGPIPVHLMPIPQRRKR